jgi:hypothetical protein
MKRPELLLARLDSNAQPRFASRLHWYRTSARILCPTEQGATVHVLDDHERKYHRFRIWRRVYVWDIDCSNLIDPTLDGIKVHGAYFDQPKCFSLMRELLRGIDRTVLFGSAIVPLALPTAQAKV